VLIVAQIMAFFKKYYQLIFIILGAGLFFWLAETAVEAFILGHGQFWSLLLSPLNIWSQVLVWLAFLIMGTIVGRNIVGYRHQVDTLHLAERKFRGLIDKSHDGIMLVDEQGRLIEWNPAMEQFTGLSRDRVLGQLAWDVQFEALTGEKSPERYQKLRQAVLDFLQTGHAPWLNKIQTVNLQNPEGEMRAGQQLAFAIQTETGIMMGTILRDITRQIIVEQSLRDSEERYRMLFERMLDGYALHEIICDDAGNPIDYRFLNINPAFETLTGLKRNIIGKTVSEVLPNIEQHWIDAYGQVALTGVPARFENYSQGAGGRWFEVVAFSPAKNKFATIFKDVTDRRRGDYQLFQLAQAVEQSPVIVLITDTNGNIEYANPRFTQVTGYNLAEVQGQNPRLLKSDEIPKEQYRHLWKTIQAGREWRGEFHNRKKDGSLYWASASISPIRDVDREITHFVAIQEDITEQKQAELERDQLFAEIQMQKEKLSALTARLSEVEEAERRRLAQELHDQVGQNLTALGLNINIVRAQLGPDTAPTVYTRLDDSLALVEETTERIRDVMANLRPPVLDDYGLAAALRWYAARLSMLVRLQIDVKEESPVRDIPVSTENALFRIAQEALNNVVKHAQAQNIIISLQYQPLRLEVVDDGFGFDPHGLPEKDFGWGLLTMQERAEAVGGHCRIESQPGQGTKVIVEVEK
jgi:PAS domain S-box-containing protein